MSDCTYYEDNQPGMALMDADPPHDQRCPRCDRVVCRDTRLGNWRHVEGYDGPFTLEQHGRDMGRAAMSTDGESRSGSREGRTDACE